MSKKQLDIDVLIIGAGPTGLTIAHELSRYGISYRIVDEKQAPSVHSKALALHARTLEIFQLMGVAKFMLERGHKVSSLFGFINKRLKFSISTHHIRSQYPYILTLAQSSIELVLIEALLKYGKAVERGISLTNLEQQDDSVAVTLTDNKGRHELFYAKWVIGCDGAHSEVRHQLKIPFTGAQYLEEFILADAKVSWDFPVKGSAAVCFSAAKAVLFFPMQDDFYRIIVLREQGASETVRFSEVVQTVEKLAPLAIEVQPPEWLASFKVHRRIVSQMRLGRIFLAGDAAHIHSPVGGQGMNTGIHDSFNLAWKLALRIKNQVKDDFLDSYHQERYPIAKKVLKATNLGYKAIFARNRCWRSIRNILLPVFFKTNTIPSFMMNTIAEVTIRYRKSSIIDYEGKLRGNRHNSLRSGEQIPDLSLMGLIHPQRTSLYQILGLTYHLLLFLDPRKGSGNALMKHYSFIQRVSQQYTPLIKSYCLIPMEAQQHINDIIPDYYFKTHPYDHRVYCQNQASIYLVRPVGYLAYRASWPNESHLLKFLSQIFYK